jgi:hypothetical protein
VQNQPALNLFLLTLSTLLSCPCWSLGEAAKHAAKALGCPADPLAALLCHLAAAHVLKGAQARAEASSVLLRTCTLLAAARARIELAPTSTLHLAVVQAADEQACSELVPLALWGLPDQATGTDATDKLDEALAWAWAQGFWNAAPVAPAQHAAEASTTRAA